MYLYVTLTVDIRSWGCNGHKRPPRGYRTSPRPWRHQRARHVMSKLKGIHPMNPWLVPDWPHFWWPLVETKVRTICEPKNQNKKTYMLKWNHQQFMFYISIELVGWSICRSDRPSLGTLSSECRAIMHWVISLLFKFWRVLENVRVRMKGW